jgi:SPP1 gp7 family putative phage head morphogenesis protein
VFSARQTDFADALRKKARKAFGSGRSAISFGALKEALAGKNHQAVEEAMSPGITAFTEAFGPGLEQTLLDVVKASGTYGARAFKGMRVSAFDPEQERDEHGQWTSGSSEVTQAQLEAKYPKAGKVVDGMEVTKDIPNETSIESSLDDYEVLSGVREVQMSDFDPDYKVNPYSTSESQRLDALTNEIERNQKIAPLIIVQDNEKYPYVLEGGHRFDALKKLGKKSFPAKVVIDTSKVKIKTLRAAAPAIKGKPFRFDATNPAALAWAKAHAGQTIDDMNEATVEDIRNLVADAFEQQFDVDELAGKIADLIGDDARAEMVARTETMRAANEGQLQLWDQATEAGILTGDEKKEWIVTPDDRLCPICEPLDGEQTGLDDTFKVDGDEIDGPPAHPRCRCTIALAP